MCTKAFFDRLPYGIRNIHVSSPSGGRLLNFKGGQYLINIKSHQLFEKNYGIT